MKTEAVRTAFTQTFTMLARQNPQLFAVTTDSRGSVTLTDFADRLPGQLVECGIAEQNAISVSAGLSSAGLRPFVCGPACFYAMRSAEQIKVDVAYSHTNVKVIGVSGGVSYGALGATHHATQDIALMRALPGLEVFIPSDGPQMRQLTRYLTQSDRPAYVRMGRGATPVVYEENVPFVPGKANRLRDGSDAAIISCGEMVYPSLQAAELLNRQKIQVSVYDMHTLKPLDREAVAEAAQTGLIVTVEEHDVYGGLGGAVAEVVAQECPTRLKIMGLPDEKLFHGSSTDIFEHYGLTPQGIAFAVREGR